MFASGVRFYTSVVFLIQQLQLLVSYLFGVSLHVVGIESEYFVVYLSCVYICQADYVELPVILYLLCSVCYITLFVQLFYARLVRSNRLVKSNKMQQTVAITGWELTKVARIGRSRSVYGHKRVEGSFGQSREPKLSVCCLRISAHPFLAKNRPGAPVLGHGPYCNNNVILRDHVHPRTLVVVKCRTMPLPRQIDVQLRPFA